MFHKNPKAYSGEERSDWTRAVKLPRRMDGSEVKLSAEVFGVERAGMGDFV